VTGRRRPASDWAGDAQGFTAAVGGELTLDDTPGGGLTVTFDLAAAS
jgi:hypothetical protein